MLAAAAPQKKAGKVAKAESETEECKDSDME
jgi:hypothetical protein